MSFKNPVDTAEKALDDVERSTLMTTKERVVLASAHFLCTNLTKKLFYCRQTARRAISIKILSTAAQLQEQGPNKPRRDRSNAVRALRSTDV